MPKLGEKKELKRGKGRNRGGAGEGKYQVFGGTKKKT